MSKDDKPGAGAAAGAVAAAGAGIAGAQAFLFGEEAEAGDAAADRVKPAIDLDPGDGPLGDGLDGHDDFASDVDALLADDVLGTSTFEDGQHRQDDLDPAADPLAPDELDPDDFGQDDQPHALDEHGNLDDPADADADADDFDLG